MSDAASDGRTPAPLWPPGQRTALCLCINVSEPLLGDGPTPAVPEPWYERAGADRLLRLLTDADVAASWTWSLPGPISEQLVAQASGAGHEIAARLRDDLLAPAQWRNELQATLTALGRMTDAPVAGVRATGTASRGELYEVIRALDLRWVIDQAYGDAPLILGADAAGAPLVHLPTSQWYDDRVVALRGGRDAGALFAHWRNDLDVVRAEGGVMVLSLHPSVSGRPGLSRAIAQLLDVAIEAGDVWIATAAAIAAWWREQHGRGPADAGQ